MKYDWIRNKICVIDGVEHIVSYRMKIDPFGDEKFTTLIIRNHITDPETISTLYSNSSNEMYQKTIDELKKLSKENYELGDEIE